MVRQPVTGRAERDGRADPPALLRHLGPSLAAALTSAAAAAIWVVLTLATGLTFHLFPALIAGGPAFTWSLLSPGNVRPWRLALFVGWPAVALAWALLEALGRMPTATFIHDQPGGVRAEIVVIALLGALISARLTR